jgi:hypothetical protein
MNQRAIGASRIEIVASNNEPRLQQEEQGPGKEDEPVNVDDWIGPELSARHWEPVGWRESEKGDGNA